VRGEVRAIKEKEYIQSARALGLSPTRIVVFHIWPNLVSPLAVAATFGLAGAITAEASLSFLGVGVPPGTPSWGALLSAGKEFLFEAPHISAFPGIAIMVTILGFNFLGEGLRERLDPKG
jgi:peptide/nickel transport system permease protein